MTEKTHNVLETQEALVYLRVVNAERLDLVQRQQNFQQEYLVLFFQR